MFQDGLFSIKDGDVVCFLDIGRSSIRCCVAKMLPSKQDFHVLHYGKKSIDAVPGPDSLREQIFVFINETEDLIGFSISKISLCINGKYLNSAIATSSYHLSPPALVNEYHIRSIVEKAIADHSLMYPRDFILDILLSDYCIDGYFSDKDAVGVTAQKISVNVNIISSVGASVERLLSGFSHYMVSVIDCMPASLCVAALCCPKTTTNNLVIHIGSLETDFAVYNSGYVLLIKNISIGGNAITNAISHRFQASFEDAEKIKLIFGGVLDTNDRMSSRLDAELSILLDKEYRIKKGDLAKIIEDVFTSIFRQIKNDIFAQDRRMKIDSVILSGGPSATSGVASIASKVFGVHSFVGDVGDRFLRSVVVDSGLDSVDNLFSYLPVLGAPRYLLEKQKRCLDMFYKKGFSTYLNKLFIMFETIF